MSAKRRIENSILAVLVICAVMVTGILVRREFFATTPGDVGRPKFVKGWRSYVRGDEWIGPASSKDTILVFSDFQCPFCKSFANTVDRVRAKGRTTIAVLHRNFPIKTIHPLARQAAIAAQCAARLGHFAEYHALLFAHQDSLATIDWTKTAVAAGVSDEKKFTTCLADPTTVGALRDDSVAAIALGLRGTPLVFVNGWRLSGNPSEEVLESALANRRRN